ncbi:MAG: CoA pyrophosphatase [Sterolibacterium sp.]|nr:CoA pyrophosphatase [Sterolibacterium sp.]
MNTEPEALPPITAAWLRERLAQPLPDNSPARQVQGFERSLFDLPPQAPTPAAVLIPLVVRNTGVTLLLTQRTQHLRDHAGQISFPGGRCEQGDVNARATALREAQEEVGLHPAQVEILGELPEYSTATGFSITPVIALVTPPLNLKLDDFEVAEVFEVPFEFLMNPGNYQQHNIEYKGVSRPYYAMPWKHYFIWGATAGMIVALQRHLFAQDGDAEATD